MILGLAVPLIIEAAEKVAVALLSGSVGGAFYATFTKRARKKTGHFHVSVSDDAGHMVVKDAASLSDVRSVATDAANEISHSTS